MFTSLKCASCAGIATVAAATGLFVPAQPPKTPPAVSQPAAAHEVSEQDCRDALERVRAIRHEINTIESRIDAAQKALGAAKSEGRLDECVKLANEIADDSKLIREKILVTEALSQGHMLEHIRGAKDFPDLQRGLNHCVLALHLERVAHGLEESETAAPKKK
jgi:hypothetical protein